MRMLFMSLLLVLGLALGPATAGPFEDGLEAHIAGDYPEAVRLFKQEAAQGDMVALINLAEMYDLGNLGVPQDYAEAVKWYLLLAARGWSPAQRRLGVFHEMGYGVRQDYAEAAKWYRLAAEKGSEYSQFKLGSMYALGVGVPQDNVLAHMWFNLAAAQGNADAAANRDMAASRMTPDQIAEAQKLAREWIAGRP